MAEFNFCPHCGEELDGEDYEFCPHCGEALE
ncbi:MAG: zinc-ribbon domain-containing protein [Candidatus Omnitrophota bacterium]